MRQLKCLFSKRPSLPFQWKHINHCSILSACMFSLWYHSEITFWNFLIRLFMNTACFLPQNVSYTKAETSSSSLPSWLGTSQDFNNFFFFLSKRALRIPSFIEQNLGKSALIFLMVYLQLCLVICCNWVEERAYSQTLGYLCNYLIEYMKDL